MGIMLLSQMIVPIQISLELRETANLHTILDIQWKLLILVDNLIERQPAFVKHHNPHGAPFYNY